MVVMHSVDHPVEPRADAVLGLEVEDDAVQPVLDKRPGEVAAGSLADDWKGSLALKRERREQGDRRQEDQGRYGRMHAGEPVEQSGGEDRRGGPELLGARLVDGHATTLVRAA